MSNDQAARLESIYRRYVETGDPKELLAPATAALVDGLLTDGVELPQAHLAAMALWSRADHLPDGDEERELASSLFEAIYARDRSVLAPEVQAAFDARAAQDEQGRDPARPQDDPGYQAALALLTRAEATQDLVALGEASRWFEARIGYASEGSALLPYLFMHLGYAGHMLAGTTSDPEPTEQAIGYLRQAADGFPAGHAMRASALTLLGNAYRLRFERTGDPDAIDVAVQFTEASVEAAGADEMSWRLHTDACMARRTRFEMGRDPADIHTAAEHARMSMATAPRDTLGGLMALANAANALSTLHRFEPAPGGQDEAIDLLHDVVRRLPAEYPRRPMILADLAIQLAYRYDEAGGAHDAAEALDVSQAALDSLPRDHPERSRLMVQRAAVVQLTGAAED